MRLTLLGKAVLIILALLVIITIVISTASINDTKKFIEQTDSFIEVVSDGLYE